MCSYAVLDAPCLTSRLHVVYFYNKEKKVNYNQSSTEKEIGY
jgi:hypothetical protein